MSFIISKKDAEKLINAYLTKVIKDSNIKVPKIVGGTIRVDSVLNMRISWNAFKAGFERTDTPISLQRYKGLTAWSCWENGTSPEDSNFFLTFEIHPTLNLNTPNTQFPIYNELAKPVEIIQYANNNDTANDIFNYPTDPGNFPPEVGIQVGNGSNDPGTILEKMNNFRLNGPRDQNGNSLNEFYFGLFDNRKGPNEVDQFLNQSKNLGMKFIRYYFGYDEEKKSNKIRIILVGLNANGDRLFPIEDGLKIKELKSEPIMLQNSWPPKTTP